jgi:LPXTG-motif cell wall-anchored protein
MSGRQGPMRRATRNGVIAAAAASGAMAAMTMPAFAEATVADAATGLAGVVSGHDVNLPVNLCRNTVNVAGVLNPAVGNCAQGGGAVKAAGPLGGAVARSAGADAKGVGANASSFGANASSVGANAHGSAADVPGLVSGHGVHGPVDLPVNVIGNGANVVGSIGGDDGVHFPGHVPTLPDGPVTGPPTGRTPDAQPQLPEPKTVKPGPAHQVPAPRTVAHHAPAAPQAASSLAHTGADAAWPALAGSMAMVFGGVILYRRFRPGTQR